MDFQVTRLGCLMKKQPAIAWLISLATFAAADPTLNSLEHTRGAFEGQHILKWAKQQEHDLDLAQLFTPIGFSPEKKFAYFIGYNCTESDATFEGKLEILDLTDNRVVFEKLYQDDFREDEFHSILDKLGIKSEASVLRRFPFQKDGDTYSVSVTSITLETDKENDEQKRDTRYIWYRKKRARSLWPSSKRRSFMERLKCNLWLDFFKVPLRTGLSF